MQDRSHKLLFLGLSGLMSAACFYGAQNGPTLLVGNDAMPTAVSTMRDVRQAQDWTAPSNAPVAAKLASEGACRGEASEISPLCLATSKISLSSP